MGKRVRRTLIHVAVLLVQIEGTFDLRLRQHTAPRQCQTRAARPRNRAARGTRQHRVPLHPSRYACSRETPFCAQHPAGRSRRRRHPAGPVQVLAHPIAMCTTTPADDAREAAQHVIEGDEAVAQDDPLDRGMLNVPLVPERDVLEGGVGNWRERASPGRRSARSRSDCVCEASPTSPSAPSRTAPRPRQSPSSAGLESRARTSRATRR